MWVTFTTPAGIDLLVDMTKVVHVSHTSSGSRLFFSTITKDAKGAEAFKSLPVSESIQEIAKVMRSKRVSKSFFGNSAKKTVFGELESN
ncbi:MULTISPECIES: hypothetical protein [unclassified Rhizobium]|uniref:hypothetical protein n=1 Tax=unclassified Rhizobium TaxID=2613769 RepID=UPI001AEB3E05|nr:MULTISPECIES: hypothetical protein [unclassified Rhizobium]MBP2459575.1 hypothetical protein [Rhizobium sp. PvP014]MBP2531869.1 hypothetical protein [Rhizobium sp. PvP099]